MASDEDCRNIMSSEFTEIGIGVYSGSLGDVWTQVFAAPRATWEHAEHRCASADFDGPS